MRALPRYGGVRCGVPLIDDDNNTLMTADGAAPDSHEGLVPRLEEVVCVQKALFLTPEGYQGVFVALPTGPDQPIPFLFVQAARNKRKTYLEYGWVRMGWCGSARLGPRCARCRYWRRRDY